MALPAIIARPLQEAGLLKAPNAGVGPIRQASPESDDAPPSLDSLIARAGDGMWLPEFYTHILATNEDEILGRHGGDLKIYDALLSDDTAFSTLQQRRLAITSKEYEVIAGDDKDPRSVKAADDFRAMVDGLGFDRVTGLLHYTVWYGYGVAEGVYSMKEHDGRLIVWLDDIVVPDRRWFGFTLEGELRYTSSFGPYNQTTRLPENKFLTLRTGGTHDFAFFGLGLAHWCYWPIFFKRAALKFWVLYLEKRGNPTVAVEFTEAQKDDEVMKAKLLAAAVAIGKDSAVLLPEGTLAAERLKIIESQRTGGTVDYKDFVGDQNEAVMRVVLGQPGTSKGVSSGLNSDQASSHREVRDELVKADSDLITDGISTSYAKWLTLWNHGPDVKPPIVRRVLEDQEDLNTTADRDVKLDGIGIKRTEDSIKATYGDGYEVERETPEEKLARETALIQAKQGVAAPAQAANDNPEAIKRGKVEEFAAQGGETAFSPLYVYRKLTNPGPLLAWAKAQGFKVLDPAQELHATVLYSKTAVDWFDMAGEGWDSAVVSVDEGGPRFVERFGDVFVLRFACPLLQWRNASMRDRGASSDHEQYNPHVTFARDDADAIDLSTIEPFTGRLEFGPEIFEPIRQKPTADDGFLAFTAEQEDAIDRLANAMIEEGHPVFAAMADHLRGALQGVDTVEGARVAILQAAETLPIDQMARLMALPFLAERAAGSVGADELVG